ncbi:hypothetical protein U1Q18_050968, partial [Sarracenia purpurea var. burkii]
ISVGVMAIKSPVRGDERCDRSNTLCDLWHCRSARLYLLVTGDLRFPIDSGEKGRKLSINIDIVELQHETPMRIHALQCTQPHTFFWVGSYKTGNDVETLTA